MANKKAYNEDSIKILKGLEGIRKRPTMYIGSIGPSGVFHLFREVIDNSLDECMEGYCTEIYVNINEPDGTINVSDNGRGIPIGKLEDILQNIHAGGKFDDDSYSYSSGLNGVGIKTTNACSDKFEIIVCRDGYEWKQSYSKGKKQTDVIRGKKTKKTGTSVFFHPDIEVLKDISIDYKEYMDFCEKISYLNKGLKIVFSAKRNDTKNLINKTFLNKNGLLDYIKVFLKKPLIDNLSISMKESFENMEADIVFSYNKNDEEIIKSFCNGVETLEHGTHVQGFKMALTSVVTKYISDNNLIPKKDSNLEITGDDVREGLVTIISIKHKNPLYTGQTKGKLTNNDALGNVKKLVTDELTDFFRSHKKEAKIICEKAIIAAKGRNAAKRARLNTKTKAEGFSSISSLHKYTKCSSKDPNEKELFICEGDSAGGTVIQARDPKIQSVYKLRGKPLNTHDLNSAKILANKEFNDICKILNIEIDKEFDITKVNYHKIIFLCDADTDGKIDIIKEG